MKAIKLILNILNSLGALWASVTVAFMTGFTEMLGKMFAPNSDFDVKNYIIIGSVMSVISFAAFILSIINTAANKSKKVYTCFEIGINVALLAIPVTIIGIIFGSEYLRSIEDIGGLIHILGFNAAMIILSLILTFPAARKMEK